MPYAPIDVNTNVLELAHGVNKQGLTAHQVISTYLMNKLRQPEKQRLEALDCGDYDYQEMDENTFGAIVS